MVRLAPALMIILLQTSAALINGYLPFATIGIVTLVVMSGTVPLHQLDAVFQSVLVAPVQFPGTQAPPTINMPDAEVPK